MTIASKAQMLRFLQDLSHNNDKAWMDEHRSEYHAAKNRWIEEIKKVLARLEKHNPAFGLVSVGDTLSRINNNRRFHPDKPVYKDFFSCESSGKDSGLSLFFFLIGVNESFVGGGMYHPAKERLQAFRNAIDYDGEAFRHILQSEPFRRFYGDINHYEDKLKTAPKGFDKDHPYVEYLRHKSITATRAISREEFLSDSFTDLVEEAYLAFRPLEAYLIKVLAYEGVV